MSCEFTILLFYSPFLQQLFLWTFKKGFQNLHNLYIRENSYSNSWRELSKIFRKPRLFPNLILFLKIGLELGTPIRNLSIFQQKES